MVIGPGSLSPVTASASGSAWAPIAAAVTPASSAAPSNTARTTQRRGAADVAITVPIPIPRSIRHDRLGA
ncbi:hypothetical protein MDOR_18920 [Mycolicibacterium doricum]|uniref:Uncharacterized protein n=1 Tax=Mycolicibacterium doricum TaxID=126673 RepID=A0A7I7VUE6_9MYCO|nr:hypothetical protein MDOR_18920 [Mycolicibacterium doricum]